MSRHFAIAVYLITAVFFGCFFLWPIWQILRGAFFDANNHFTIGYIVEVFRNPIYVEGLINSFWLALCATSLAMLIAVPLAWMADRYEFPGKKLFMATVLLPIMLPPFVGAIGVKQIFGAYGAFNAVLQKVGLLGADQTIDWLGRGQFMGVVVVVALGLYPILYLNALAALSNIDPAMEEAAENLGCKGWKRFLKITLPLMRPGLFAGGTIVFIWSFTELGVPLIFDYTRLASVQIFYSIKEIGASPFPYALVSVMLFCAVLIYATGKGLFGRDTHAMMAKAGHAGGPKKPKAWLATVCFLSFLGISLLALLPHLGVILISFSSDWFHSILPQRWTLENFELALGHGLTISSIQNSLVYAGLATCVNVALGVAIAYVVVRTKLPGRNVLDAMAMLPLAVPGLVMAFGYLAMTQSGKLFSALNPVDNPLPLLVIAYSIRKLPFVVRSAVAGLQQTSVTYEEAAQNLGCSPFKTTLKITLPLIAASLVAGAILAFAQSMLEVSDSIILAQKAQYYPITKAIYELMQFIGDGRFLASALGVWAMAFLALTIISASLLLGKKLGSIFRV
ncbi:MAG: iron ABC transporter permease [Verrucomicrobiota bacterium]|nr:iron ABC transporter permease [Verrucomicrobiota bacterium]